MTKQEFMKKHNLTEQDWRNLLRYEQVKQSGTMNMFEYLGIMKKYNANGGTKLAEFIMEGNNYAEFMEVLENE